MPPLSELLEVDSGSLVQEVTGAPTEGVRAETETETETDPVGAMREAASDP